MYLKREIKQETSIKLCRQQINFRKFYCALLIRKSLICVKQRWTYFNMSYINPNYYITLFRIDIMNEDISARLLSLSYQWHVLSHWITNHREAVIVLIGSAWAWVPLNHHPIHLTHVSTYHITWLMLHVNC